MVAELGEEFLDFCFLVVLGRGGRVVAEDLRGGGGTLRASILG